MVNGGRQKQMLQRVDGRLKVRWMGGKGGGGGVVVIVREKTLL